MKNKDLIKYEKSFFGKIKKILSKLFLRNRLQSIENEKNNIIENNRNDSNSFINDIIIKQDEEEIRILNIQKAYKSGKIKEENISEDDKNKLIDLYKKQNNQLKDTIKKEKSEIKKILDDLKAS